MLDKLNEKKDEAISFGLRYIKTIAMDIVVVLVALAYVFYQMIKLEVTNLNPLVLLAQAAMGIICGITIKQALGENGFSKGYNSEYWAQEEKKYNDACTVAVEYIDKVDNFYEYEKIEKKKNFRRQHLQEKGLKYSMWFDDDGNYIGEPINELKKSKKYTRKQIRMINRCINVKIYPLNLFSQFTISTEKDTEKEPTDKQQRAKNLRNNTIAATLIAIIGVYFIPQLAGWNLAAFISATLQVTLWTIFGVLQLYQNYNFVIVDLVGVMRKKKEGIAKFLDGCKKNKYDYSPYDDPRNVEIANCVLPNQQNNV